MKKTVRCPNCKIEYNTNPSNKVVQCMDCGHNYFQNIEIINFTEGWIKEAFYRTKG